MDGWIGLSGCRKWMWKVESGCGLWIWKVDVDCGYGKWKVDVDGGKWIVAVESGAVPDLTLLITNSKSHMGFRLVPTSMILNDLERHSSPYFAFFHQTRQIFRPIVSQWLKINL